MGVANWSLERLLLHLKHVKTKLQAGQDKFKQNKSDKPSSWGLAEPVQILWPVTSNSVFYQATTLQYSHWNLFSLENQGDMEKGK